MQYSFIGASLSEPLTYRTAVQNPTYIFIIYIYIYVPSVCTASNLAPRRAPLTLSVQIQVEAKSIFGGGCWSRHSDFSGYARDVTRISPDSSPDTRPSNSCSELAAIWATRLARSSTSQHYCLPTNQAHPCACTDIT